MTPRTAAESVELQGVRFAPLDLEATVAAVQTLMEADGLAHVVTANLDYMARIRRDPDLAETVRRADLVVADGVPVLWMARWTGRRLPGRVNGTDLVVRLLALAADRGWPVAMLGADPGVAETAAGQARRRWGTPVEGCWPLTRDDVEDADRSRGIASEVGALGRPLVLVALPTGRQEAWIACHRQVLGSGVVIGIGSALDFVAGTRRRAPRLCQRAGLEWLWRMAHEPRRLWRRYLVDDLGLLARFATTTLRARLRRA